MAAAEPCKGPAQHGGSLALAHPAPAHGSSGTGSPGSVITKPLRFGRAGGREGGPLHPRTAGGCSPLRGFGDPPGIPVLQAARIAKTNQSLNLFDFCPKRYEGVRRGEREGNAALGHVFLCKGCRNNPRGIAL